MNTYYYRRDFLRKVAAIAGVLMFNPFSGNSTVGKNPVEHISTDGVLTPRINPAFRMNLFSDGTLELFTFQKPGSKISAHYSGIEAGILLLIAENKPINENLKALANQYSLSYSDCQNQTSLAMEDFKQKGLVYFGDLMLVKKSEVTYEYRR
jgi:hypothetical protein